MTDPNWAPPGSPTDQVPPPLPPPHSEDQPKPPRNKAALLAGGVAALLGAGFLASALSDPEPAEDPEDAAAVTADADTAPGEEAATTGSQEANVTTTVTLPAPATETETTNDRGRTESEQAAIDAAAIGAGTYIVGTDIEPGRYRVTGYVETRDEPGELIANELAYNGTGLFDIDEDDYLVQITGGEAIPLEALPEIDPLFRKFTDGTYIVGIDIEPGRYELRPAGDTGNSYAARLAEDLSLIDNEFGEANIIINVLPTDYALEIQGVVTPLK